jgi:hypothetical protein
MLPKVSPTPMVTATARTIGAPIAHGPRRRRRGRGPRPDTRRETFIGEVKLPDLRPANGEEETSLQWVSPIQPDTLPRVVPTGYCRIDDASATLRTVSPAHGHG